MRNNPCQKCDDRYPGCSGQCTKEDYIKFKSTLRKIKENKIEEYKKEYALFSIRGKKR